MMPETTTPLKTAIIEPVGGHGGMNYYDFGLCRGLSSAGVEPVLYTCDATDVTDAAFQVELFFKGIYGADSKLKRALRYMKGLLRALSDARARGARIAHFHLFHTTALEWISLKTARLYGLKTVLTVHDVESFSGDSYKGLARRIYSLADLLIVHNRISYQALCESAPDVSSKTVIIPHGNYINYIIGDITRAQARKKLGIDDKGHLLLFWGQIKEVKGLDILLEALPKVVKADPDIKLVIAGKVWKDDFTRYDELIKKHGLDGNIIRHIRYIPDAEAGYYFNAADIVILPYRKIYQSGVLLMALSYGRPVVVSDLPGMTEAVEDGKTGFVFRSGDPEALAGKITAAVCDNQLTDRIAEAGFQMVKRDFDWYAIGTKTAEAYRRLL